MLKLAGPAETKLIGCTAQPTNNSTTEPTDEQLLAAFQAGDLSAYEALDQRYRSRLTGYVRLRLDADMQEGVDDIVQKTLVYLYRKAALFTKPNTVVQSILFKRAFRYIRDFKRDSFRACRDRGRTVLFTDGGSLMQNHRELYDWGRPSKPDCLRDLVDRRGAEKAAAAEEVRQYLSQLTPSEAEIIRLIRIEGHTAQSAADILHINLTTAQWRYRKAWEHLEQIARRAEVA